MTVYRWMEQFLIFGAIAWSSVILIIHLVETSRPFTRNFRDDGRDI